MPVIGQKQHFVDFWEGGIKKSEGFYERGFEHGTWKYYYQSGELHEEANYFIGKLHGKVIKYHENGERLHEGKWVLGMQDSLMQSWSDKGVLLEKGWYLDDEKTGFWEYFHASGDTMLVEEYIDSNTFIWT